MRHFERHFSISLFIKEVGTEKGTVTGIKIFKIFHFYGEKGKRTPGIRYTGISSLLCIPGTSP